MKPYKKIALFAVPFLMIVAGCTKLNENLNDTLTSAQVTSSFGTAGPGLLLASAYADIAGIFFSQDLLFSLQECTTDEALVPTRGGDWDDNGVWRVLHNHTWNADHGQILSVFNALNKMSFDATNVLGFSPTAAQKAEARVLRAIALYHLLDLYGQYPFRDPLEDLRKLPVVKSGAEGINFIIAELTAALPDVPASNPVTKVTPDAVRFLLMRCYLNKGAFINRTAPTFDAADMNQVITLGNAIISSAKYSYTTNYFDNFAVNNDVVGAKEAIFTYPNTSGVGVNHGGIESRWNMTLHYNAYTPKNPNAGWNGFSTISQFYSSFNTTAAATTFGPADTLLDKRLGGRYYSGSTDVSGLRPGFLVGQQFNEAGVAIKDRNGAPLAYTSALAANMIESGATVEVAGIRVVKYVPDYLENGKNYGGPAGNDLLLFRYPDVVLMVAEAQMRSGVPAATSLLLINGLRTARGAAVVATMPLVNTADVDAPNTLLAERGRELYWESVRRTDLIRFGVFSKPWGLKPVDDVKYILFPIPNQALAANPNLKQNPGY